MASIEQRTDLLLSAVNTAMSFEVPSSTYVGVSLGDVMSRTIGNGRETAYTREYEPGDDMRMVDHFASARLGNLVVRETHKDISPSFMVLSDAVATHYAAGVEDDKEWFGSKQFVALAFSLTALMMARKEGHPVSAVFHAGGDDERSVVLKPTHSSGKIDDLAGQLVEVAAYEAEQLVSRETKKGLFGKSKVAISRRTDSEGKTALRDTIDRALKIKCGKGIAIIVSDGLRPMSPNDTTNGWAASLNDLARRHQTTFVHLKAGIDTQLTGDLASYTANDGQVVTTDRVLNLQENYHKVALEQQLAIRAAVKITEAEYFGVSLDNGSLYDQFQSVLQK